MVKVALRGAGGRGIKGAVSECMEACQWEDLVKPGALVVIKPNLCTPEPDKALASNTQMEITEAVCELLLSRTKHILVGESNGLRYRAQEAFAVSGYVPMLKRLGIPLLNFSELPTQSVDCGTAGHVDLPEAILKADLFITLPVLKTHALTYFTGALKNQWGCIPQHDRILLHQYLDSLIPTLNKVLRTQLAIMDGIVGTEGRGPTNGKPRRLDVVLGSRDPVALDATAMRLVGLEPARALHLTNADKLGLGTIDSRNIVVDGDWDKYRTQFEPAILDKAIAAMNYMTRYRWFVKYALEQNYIFYPVRALVQLLRRVGIVEGG